MSSLETSSDAIETPKEVSNRYRWYVVVVLALVYTSSQVDRQIMGILLQPIKNDLGASDTEMGFLVGLTFALFYATLGMPIAMFADRNSRRNVITAAITVWSVMTVVCGFVTSFFQMALARIGVAIGEAGSTPASHSIISDLFGPEKRATAMALFTVGANIGVLIAFLGGGLMADTWGWRTAFIAVGVPGVLVALLLLFTVKEPARTKGHNEEGEKAAGFKETFAYMFENPALRHITFGKSLGGFISYGFIMWLPAFLIRSHELTTTQVGVSLALLIGIGGGLGTVLSGRIVDYVGKFDPKWRARSIAISKIAIIPFTVGFLLVDNWIVALSLYLVPAIFAGFYLAPSAALIQVLVKNRMRALASAISLFLINLIGMGLGPQAVGIVSDLLNASGTDSLRYALVIFTGLNVWCAFHYWRAGAYLKPEQFKS